MVKQTVLVCAVLLSLTGCVTYGGQRFIPSPEQEAAMQADSRRVQNDERAERAERRRERREEMRPMPSTVLMATEKSISFINL